MGPRKMLMYGRRRMQILIAFWFFLNGAQLIAGKTRVFKIPYDFGQHAPIAGWIFLLLGAALVLSAFDFGKKKSDRQT